MRNMISVVKLFSTLICLMSLPVYGQDAEQKPTFEEYLRGLAMTREKIDEAAKTFSPGKFLWMNRWRRDPVLGWVEQDYEQTSGRGGGYRAVTEYDSGTHSGGGAGSEPRDGQQLHRDGRQPGAAAGEAREARAGERLQLGRSGFRQADGGGLFEDERAALGGSETGRVPASVLLRQHKQVVDRFSKTSKSSFDKNYMAETVNDHNEAVRLFQHEAEAGKVASLSGWPRALPTVKEHLALARETAGVVGADVTATATAERERDHNGWPWRPPDHRCN